MCLFFCLMVGGHGEVIFIMLTRVLRRFSTTTNKTYGKLKDSDRIFTNVYKDSDPYITGALRRVTLPPCRATGTEPKTSSLTGQTGSSTRSSCQASGDEAAQASPRDSNTHSCPRSPPRKDPATWSSMPISQSQAPAKTGKF